MKTIFFVVTTIFFLSLTTFSQSTPPTKDWQFWNETIISFPLIKKTGKDQKSTDKLSFFIIGNVRTGQNFRHFTDERIGFGFDYVVNKHVTISPNYIYRAGQTFKNQKDYENRPRLDVTLEQKWKNVVLKNRNRIEYRFRNSRADQTRYRNRLLLLFPVRKENKEIFAPFVSTEPFIDLKEKHITRNELFVGINKKLAPNITADFFYVWQRNRGNTLKDVNGLGVNFRFRID